MWIKGESISSSGLDMLPQPYLYLAALNRFNDIILHISQCNFWRFSILHCECCFVIVVARTAIHLWIQHHASSAVSQMVHRFFLSGHLLVITIYDYLNFWKNLLNVAEPPTFIRFAESFRINRAFSPQMLAQRLADAYFPDTIAACPRKEVQNIAGLHDEVYTVTRSGAPCNMNNCANLY